MKKVIFLCTVAAFIGFSAKSQTATFGVKAGITGSNLKVSASGISINMTTKIGYYAGVIADLNVADNFSVQPELYYSLLGAKASGDAGGGVMVSGKDDYGYINLPVLLKYKNEGFSVFLGPQIGVLVSAKEKSDNVSQDVKDELKSADFSGIIGAGYTLSNGFGLDARYQLGFGNIAKEAEGFTVKNNAFMVGFHYFFNRG